MRTFTHTHTHTLTHTHIYAHTHSHTHTHTCTHAQLCNNGDTQIHVRAQTHALTCTDAPMHKPVPRSLRTRHPQLQLIECTSCTSLSHTSEHLPHGCTPAQPFAKLPPKIQSDSSQKQGACGAADYCGAHPPRVQRDSAGGVFVSALCAGAHISKHQSSRLTISSSRKPLPRVSLSHKKQGRGPINTV